MPTSQSAILSRRLVARAVVERRDRLDGVVERAHRARLSRREDGREETQLRKVVQRPSRAEARDGLHDDASA